MGFELIRGRPNRLKSDNTFHPTRHSTSKSTLLIESYDGVDLMLFWYTEYIELPFHFSNIEVFPVLVAADEVPDRLKHLGYITENGFSGYELKTDSASFLIISGVCEFMSRPEAEAREEGLKFDDRWISLYDGLSVKERRIEAAKVGGPLAYAQLQREQLGDY
ncbi:hypothetical protein [Deinococcus sp.]|uniref:hypothetical protein n=1 Tax=Deinococcus sp. TaxID=47478 RepID=UPI0025D744CC|nr:hypothetical protein [Deinococcus sp.]